MTDLKITMDNSAGWPADTQISLLIEPRVIAFVASGAAPYSLTLGQHNVNSAQALPIQSLINGYQAGAEYRLPLASLIDLNEQEVVSMNTSEAHRPYLLWGVLTAGVLLLFFMVFVVVRQMSNKKQP